MLEMADFFQAINSNLALITIIKKCKNKSVLKKVPSVNVFTKPLSLITTHTHTHT